MNISSNNNFKELTSNETSSINGGGWLSIIGGGLIIASGVATGGAIPITVGIISGVSTMVSGL